METISTRLIHANGQNLFVREAGRGPTVLFLHGFPEHSGAWLGVMARLSGRFRTIAVDTRGVGRSPVPPNEADYHLSHLVEDVRQLIARLGGPITLVGHDWGGFIAWELAIRHPELLSKLVIINAAHLAVFDQLLRTDERQIVASQYMLAFRSKRGEELVARDNFKGFRTAITEPAVRRGTMTSVQVQDYFAYWQTPARLTAALNYYRANESGPGSTNAPRSISASTVGVQTLVIWGDQDPYFIPCNVDRLPEVVRSLTVERFPKHGHWIVHENPDAIARLITQFAQ